MLNRLKFKIFALIIAVSIPAAALVSFLAYRSALTAQRVELSSLSSAAEILSLSVEENIAAAKNLSNALSQTLSFQNLKRELCNTQLRSILDRNKNQAALFVFKNEKPFCGVARDTVLPLEKFPWPRSALEETGSGFVNIENGLAAIWVSRRVEEAGNIYTVFTVLDDDFLDQELRTREEGNGRFSALVTSSNSLVASSSDQARSSHQATLIDGSWVKSRLTERVVDSNVFVYVAYPLSSVSARIVTGQPQRLLFAASGNQLYLAILTSILMLLLPIAAIWWGIDRLVLRWLTHYSQITSAYAEGDQLARMRDPSSAMPLEVAQVAQSFNDMADKVAARTAELEQEISRKQIYVRELHHRVKNILQMIASMLAMEAREASQNEGEPEGINRASRRIAALGATYAIFYGYSERGQAPLATVLNEAVSRLGLGAAVRAVNYEASGDFEANVDLDISIAITMLVAEYLSAYLLTNELGTVNVSTFIGKSLEINIDAPEPPEISTLAGRFINAYIRQLGATQTQDGAKFFVKIKLSGFHETK